MNVEAMTERLKSAKSAATLDTSEESQAELKKRKLVQWEEVKRVSLTRTFTAVYTVVLLMILIKVQLNLVARYTYLDSIESLEDRTEEGGQQQPGGSKKRSLPFDAEKKYLALSWYFLHQTVQKIQEQVEQAVNEVISVVPLSKKLDVEQLNRILFDIRCKIEYTSANVEGKAPKHRDLGTWLLPPVGQESEHILRGLLQIPPSDPLPDAPVSPTDPASEEHLRNLIEETRSFLTSPDFYAVSQSCLNAASDYLSKNILVDMNGGSSSGMSTELVPTGSQPQSILQPVSKPFAMILPMISKQAHQILNGHPNVFIQVLAENEALHAFSAVIYSSFDA